MSNNVYSESDSDSEVISNSIIELLNLKKACDYAIYPANLPFRERWLEVFDNLYRSSEDGQTQALLFAQSQMSHCDYLYYLEYNQNNDYDEEELEREGITHLTNEEIYHYYLYYGQPLQPANLQPLFNHVCRMGNLDVVRSFIEHNHNNRQPQLNIKIGLITATLQNHYSIIDYLLQYLGDDFDEHIIQLIFLAYQKDNYHLAYRLLHRPIHRNSIQNAENYLIHAINLNAIFLVEIMLKHWYHNPEMKKHLYPYGHAIDLQNLYHQSLMMNQIEITDYLENQYTELRKDNPETLNLILYQSTNPTLLVPAIEKVTKKIRPKSTLTKKISMFCQKTIFPATICTLFFFYNQMMVYPSSNLIQSTSLSSFANVTSDGF